MSMLQCMKVYWKYDWKGLRKQEGFLPSAVGHHLPRPNNLPSLPSGVAGTHLWKISTPNRSGGGFCFFNHKAYGIHWNQLSEKERTFVKIPSASFFWAILLSREFSLKNTSPNSMIWMNTYSPNINRKIMPTWMNHAKCHTSPTQVNAPESFVINHLPPNLKFVTFQISQSWNVVVAALPTLQFKPPTVRLLMPL